jgi:hypothetical protein
MTAVRTPNNGHGRNGMVHSGERLPVKQAAQCGQERQPKNARRAYRADAGTSCIDT